VELSSAAYIASYPGIMDIISLPGFSSETAIVHFEKAHVSPFSKLGKEQ